MKKRALVIFLSLTLFLLSLVGCGEDSLSKEEEQELFDAIQELVEESRVLNEIYFGEGIPVLETGKSVGVYKECNQMILAEWGFDSIDDIKSKTRSIYTESMSSWLSSYAFLSITSGAAVVGARYYEDEDGTLMVSTNADVLLRDDVTYDYSTLEIVSQRNGIVALSMDATVTNAQGKTQTREISLEAEREGSKWKLNSPTYLVYDEGLPSEEQN